MHKVALINDRPDQQEEARQVSIATVYGSMALAHTISNKVEAAYRRGDLFEKRRNLAQAWVSLREIEGVRGKVAGFASLKISLP